MYQGMKLDAECGTSHTHTHQYVTDVGHQDLWPLWVRLEIA